MRGMKEMKANFSTNDLINIQVASRLSDLLFDPAPENQPRRSGFAFSRIGHI